MEMEMDKNKFLLGSMASTLDNPTAQQIAFPMFDFAALAPFAMSFPTAAFPAAAFQNALQASPVSVESMAGMPFLYDMSAFASPFMFPAPVSSSAQPAFLESVTSPPSVIDSPDLPVVSSEELLAFNMESPVSLATSLPSPTSQKSSTPIPRSTSGSGGKIKKKKRKPKPRMADLSETEAQAKRDSNRESARKSRDRKRERERTALDENEVLRKEVAELSLKVQVLSDLLLEKGNLL